MARHRGWRLCPAVLLPSPWCFYYSSSEFPTRARGAVRTRMNTRHFIAIGATCLLAACAAGQNSQPPAEPVVSISPDTLPPDALPPDALSAQSSTATPATEPGPAPVREGVQESVRAAPAPAPSPPADPKTLLGLAPEAVDKLLGQPELVRRDGPAEVRLYRDTKQTCTFHVFLYKNGQAGQQSSVEYFEARNDEGRLGEAGIAACYRALVQPAVTS